MKGDILDSVIDSETFIIQREDDRTADAERLEEFMRSVERSMAPSAPTRAVSMPKDAAERKRSPVASGVLDYFPDALIEVARVSFEGNEQHNPGQRLHWDRSKSTDEADALIRHFLERGLRDVDGMRHSAKMAWRALALLQKEIEAERNDPTK